MPAPISGANSDQVDRGKSLLGFGSVLLVVPVGLEPIGLPLMRRLHLPVMLEDLKRRK